MKKRKTAADALAVTTPPRNFFRRNTAELPQGYRRPIRHRKPPPRKLKPLEFAYWREHQIKLASNRYLNSKRFARFRPRPPDTDFAIMGTLRGGDHRRVFWLDDEPQPAAEPPRPCRCGKELYGCAPPGGGCEGGEGGEGGCEAGGGCSNEGGGGCGCACGEGGGCSCGGCGCGSTCSACSDVEGAQEEGPEGPSDRGADFSALEAQANAADITCSLGCNTAGNAAAAAAGNCQGDFCGACTPGGGGCTVGAGGSGCSSAGTDWGQVFGAAQEQAAAMGATTDFGDFGVYSPSSPGALAAASNYGSIVGPAETSVELGTSFAGQNASLISNAALNSPSALAPSVVGALTNASLQGATQSDLASIAAAFGVSPSGPFGQFSGQEIQNIPAPQSDPRIGPTNVPFPQFGEPGAFPQIADVSPPGGLAANQDDQFQASIQAAQDFSPQQPGQFADFTPTAQAGLDFATTPFGQQQFAATSGADFNPMSLTFGGVPTQTTDFNAGDFFAPSQMASTDFAPPDLGNFSLAPPTEGTPIGGDFTSPPIGGDFASMPANVGTGASLAGIFGGLAPSTGGAQYAMASGLPPGQTQADLTASNIYGAGPNMPGYMGASPGLIGGPESQQARTTETQAFNAPVEPAAEPTISPDEPSGPAPERGPYVSEAPPSAEPEAPQAQAAAPTGTTAAMTTAQAQAYEQGARDAATSLGAAGILQGTNPYVTAEFTIDYENPSGPYPNLGPPTDTDRGLLPGVAEQALPVTPQTPIELLPPDIDRTAPEPLPQPLPEAAPPLGPPIDVGPGRIPGTPGAPIIPGAPMLPIGYTPIQYDQGDACASCAGGCATDEGEGEAIPSPEDGMTPEEQERRGQEIIEEMLRGGPKEELPSGMDLEFNPWGPPPTEILFPLPPEMVQGPGAPITPAGGLAPLVHTGTARSAEALGIPLGPSIDLSQPGAIELLSELRQAMRGDFAPITVPEFGMPAPPGLGPPPGVPNAIPPEGLIIPAPWENIAGTPTGEFEPGMGTSVYGQTGTATPAQTFEGRGAFDQYLGPSAVEPTAEELGAGIGRELTAAERIAQGDQFGPVAVPPTAAELGAGMRANPFGPFAAPAMTNEQRNALLTNQISEQLRAAPKSDMEEFATRTAKNDFSPTNSPNTGFEQTELKPEEFAAPVNRDIFTNELPVLDAERQAAIQGREDFQPTYPTLPGNVYEGIDLRRASAPELTAEQRIAQGEGLPNVPEWYLGATRTISPSSGWPQLELRPSEALPAGGGFPEDRFGTWPTPAPEGQATNWPGGGIPPGGIYTGTNLPPTGNQYVDPNFPTVPERMGTITPSDRSDLIFAPPGAFGPAGQFVPPVVQAPGPGVMPGAWMNPPPDRFAPVNLGTLTPPPPMGGEGRGIYAGGPYDYVPPVTGWTSTPTFPPGAFPYATPPPPMGGEGRGIYAGGPYDWTGPPPMIPGNPPGSTPPTLDQLRQAPFMDPRAPQIAQPPISPPPIQTVPTDKPPYQDQSVYTGPPAAPLPPAQTMPAATIPTPQGNMSVSVNQVISMITNPSYFGEKEIGQTIVRQLITRALQGDRVAQAQIEMIDQALQGS